MPLVKIKSLLLTLLNLLDIILSCLPSVGKFRPIKGRFSAEERLKNNLLNGGYVCLTQEPGTYQQGSVTEIVNCNQHHHQPWPVFWVRSDNALLVGKMLHWRDEADLICDEGLFKTKIRRSLSEDYFFSQILLKSPQILPGAWTSIISSWGNGGNYYHWLCDSITRLLVREHLPEDTRILIPANPSRFVRETIELLGLSNQCLEAPSTCILPERFYFCSPTAMTGVWNPIGFNWLREKFSKYRSQSETEHPIFFTRRGTTRIPKDIDRIEAIFKEHGFIIVDCGSLTVKEQIWISSCAPAIAGLHGAAMTNILWARPTTPVLELFSPDYLNGCYEQIANQGNLAYCYSILDDDSSKRISLWLKGLKTEFSIKHKNQLP